MSENPDLLPGWVVEYPHQGDPSVYRCKSLDELEDFAEHSPGAPVYTCLTYEEALDMVGDETNVRGLGCAAWVKLAVEKRGVVTFMGEDWDDAEWYETAPERTFESRYEDAKGVLGVDLSHVKIGECGD